jgi:hypothetical protein
VRGEQARGSELACRVDMSLIGLGPAKPVE